MTQKVVKPIALDESFRTTEQNPQNIADVLANKLDDIKSAIENGSSDEMEAAFECHYNVTSATDIYNAMQEKKVPFFYQNGVVAQLWKVETNKYTFRTTSTRVVEGENILDIVDYIVNGSVWSTATKTISSGSSSQQAYLAKVESSVNFDTTGLSGMQSIISVNDVPADGVYQLSIFMCITPKTASATKSDLVFQFTGTSGTGMPNTTFHAVVDDSQIFAQQLSFSTTLNLKAGTNSLKIACGGLNTEYLVFVDNLTVAQLVNGVYHNGDNFNEVHTLTQASNFNNDDGVLVDGANGGPRFMLWQTLANKVLGFIKSLSTTITSFRTGDVILVDGPSGTANMGKDDLLKETAQNALANKVAQLFNASSTYNVGDRVIYNGVQYRCTTPHTGAFDVSHFTITTSSYEDYVLGINFAPKFSTSTNYRKGELVTLGGSLWRFKVAHSAGAWDVSEMELVNVANLYALQVNRRFTKMLTNSGFEQGRFDINGTYGGFSSTSPDHIKWCSHRNILNLTSAKILKITQSSGYNADVFLQTYTVTTDSDYNDTFTKSTRYQYSVKSGVDFYIDVSAVEYGRLSFNVNNGIPCITTDIEVSLEFTPYTSLPADEKNYYEDLPNSDNLSGRCVVNQQGDGDYTDIGTAYNAHRTGTNPALIDFIVQNGAYDCVNVAKLWAKGETKDYTIIRNTSASYPYAASMIGIGIIDTFTFYAHNVSPDNPAYALHIDLERNKNERCIYRNCRFISTRNCAIGVGMTKGYALWFEDCEFLSHSTTDAGAFFHDARASLGEGNYGGLQWLTFVRCKFKSKSEFALRILSVESSNKLIVTFIDCTFESDITANQNSVRICGTTTEGYLCGDSILLGSKSHGNNVDLLNAW